MAYALVRWRTELFAEQVHRGTVEVPRESESSRNVGISIDEKLMACASVLDQIREGQHMKLSRSRILLSPIAGGATIGTGSTMVGTLLADASITLSTTGGSPPTAVITTLNGRAIALTAGVSMTNTAVNVPAP